jgi:hypothetical protein
VFPGTFTKERQPSPLLEFSTCRQPCPRPQHGAWTKLHRRQYPEDFKGVLVRCLPHVLMGSLAMLATLVLFGERDPNDVVIAVRKRTFREVWQ